MNKVFYSSALLLCLSLPAAASDLTLANIFELRMYEETLDQEFIDAVEANTAAEESLAGAEGDLWERIRDGFAMEDIDNANTHSQLSLYSKKPQYVERTTRRAAQYLYHVVEELEKRNMPTELALLPFVESGFDPAATSHAKAAGMWQFIPSTGRDFNLKQNHFKDERRDVIASTDAALTYLQKLHAMFGDWHLALAAYNWGEGSVQRAIKKNRAAGKKTDFVALAKLMPEETRNYVPRLQAIKTIVQRPAEFNISLPEVNNEPYFVAVEKTRDIDISVAAQLAEMPVAEFKALNPQFKRPVIIGDSDTRILLPLTKVDRFKTNIKSWSQALSSWSAHTVSSAREKIEVIAKRFGTTAEVLRKVNNIPPRMQVAKGSTILVPRTPVNAGRDISASLADRAVISMVADRPRVQRITVKVGKRDTLSSIAGRFKVSVKQIVKWNGLKKKKIMPGQILRLTVAAHAIPKS